MNELCYMVNFKDEKKQKIVCDQNYNQSDITRWNISFKLITRILKYKLCRIKHKLKQNWKKFFINIVLGMYVILYRKRNLKLTCKDKKRTWVNGKWKEIGYYVPVWKELMYSWPLNNSGIVVCPLNPWFLHTFGFNQWQRTAE